MNKYRVIGHTPSCGSRSEFISDCGLTGRIGGFRDQIVATCTFADHTAWATS